MSESIATRSTLATLGIAYGVAAGKTRRGHRNYRAAIERARVRAATEDATKDDVTAEEVGHVWRERRERQFAILRQIVRTPATDWQGIDTKAQAFVTSRMGLPDNHPSAATLLALAESVAADMRRLIGATAA